MKDYQHYFGISFQVIDDVLDLIGQEAELGKPVSFDLNEDAVTLPAIIFAQSNADGNPIRNIV